MLEVWKQIEDFPYEISNFGRVKSHNNTRNGKTKIIDGTVMKNGYRTISINKKKYYVHRLVGKYFVEGYSEELHINHKDGDKLNNHHSNLEWVTNEENVRHAWKNGLVNIPAMKHYATPEETEKRRANHSKNKKVLNTETGEIYRSCRECARQIGSDSSCLAKRIKLGKPHKGVLYKYI